MNIRKYLSQLIVLRYFIWHMVKIDLKNKFRRSKLGILWTFLSPFLLSCIMGVVFSVAFKIPLKEYMPYVMSGILFWDLVTSSFSAGGHSIIAHDSYIRQCNHPISIYTLKNSIVYMISFLIALLALIIWSAFGNPFNILIWVPTVPLTVLIYFMFSWGGTTIAGYTCVQYRDYPMMAPLILQIVWYLSPIFFQESMFESNVYMHKWFMINPVTHMLNLLREPLLHGLFPSIYDYCICFVFVFLIDLFAIHINKCKERDVIFYL